MLVLFATKHKVVMEATARVVALGQVAESR